MSEFCITEPLDLTEYRHDYDHVRKAIEFISQNWRDHPSLDTISDHIGLSSTHFQKTFKRWAGLSPKDFLQAITLSHARDMLHGSASLLEIAHELGLSGPARLHDLFISHEAMTPGEFKRLGEGLEIRFGFHDSPFGLALIMTTKRRICGLGFCDSEEEQDALLQDMMERWPDAAYQLDQPGTALLIKQIFTPEDLFQSEAKPIKIILIGSDFEIRIWETLLKVPAGRAVTYSDLAEHIGNPNAHRAVGSAVGRNPISFVVPCHRVLRKDASLGGYHWGITRKQAILGWEAGKLRAEVELMG